MFSDETLSKLELLDEKFKAKGQDLNAYLDGLYFSEFLTYWDYVHLDTLLSLQKPRTKIKDEKIFIVYHQITELYFNLCLHEFEQIRTAGEKDLNETYVLNKVKRINNYFKALISSYEIMVDGMEKEQFLNFRMALLPASGFQSAQYRKIEIASSHLHNLINFNQRNEIDEQASIAELYNYAYWKKGAIDLKTGKKTLTLKMFEERYDKEFIEFSEMYEKRNLHYIVKNIVKSPSAELIDALRTLDINVNVNWPLSHYKSAVRYLQKDPENVEATGGTNWQKYLPPRFQKVIFFPEFWTSEEQENWGKSWVESAIKNS